MSASASGGEKGGAVAVHWFRKGLRLHDNPALVDACKGATQVYPLFVLDPSFADPEKVGINRYRFLLQALEDLDQSLRGHGSRLYVAQGKPEEQVLSVMERVGASRLTFESDTEPYAKKRDAEVIRLAKANGCAVVTHATHTLRSPEDYMAKCRGQVPISYQKFCSLFDSMGPVTQMAPLVDGSLLPCSSSSSGSVIGEEEMRLPSLTDMGYDESTLTGPAKYPGGETVAVSRLQEYMKKKQWVATFEKPKTVPNSLEPSTTVLSPYMKFGCLSPRLFYHELAKVYREAKGGHSKPPVSLLGQLLWREFFYLCGHGIPRFDRMEGNRICKQIPWRRDPALLSAWKEARTGYPFIDAIMTQLRTEGWIHHLARHAVACFLTRGDLYQHWEEGVKVFDLWLLDADWSLNNGNWLWLSASAFFYQFMRVYSPVVFGQKTDKNGDYIRKYLPQLRKFPSQYIYEPWKAPRSVQESCGCIIGADYPRPIVDHAIVSKENIGRHKAAYDAGKPGVKVEAQKEEEQDDDEAGGGGGGGKKRAKAGGESSGSKKKKRAKAAKDESSEEHDD